MPVRARHLVIGAAVLGPSLGLGGLAAAQVTILPGNINTGISAISDDGTHVSGTRTGLGAFFWSQASDYRYLTYPRRVGTPVSLSGDGHTIVTLSGEFSTQFQTFLETDTGGVTVLPISIPGFVNQSNPTSISRDGSVVCGWDGNTSNGNEVGWRWTASGGTQVLPGFQAATAMSGDGSTVFGNTGGGTHVVWRNGITTLLPSGVGEVLAANYDGTIYAGSFGSIWHGAVPTIIPLLPGMGGSRVSDINEDGSVVVGTMSDGSAENNPAFVWTASGGTQPLGAYFASYGYDLSGYRITVAHVSADGRTFGMQGQSTADNSIRGIIVTIPAPPTVGVLAGLLAFKRHRR